MQLICWLFLPNLLALSGDPPAPQVAVTVAVEGQLATEDEAPFLPDDYAGRSRPEVRFVEPVQSAGLTLFTADGWPCAACVMQEREIRSSGVDLSLFTVVKHDQVAARADGGVYPRWVDSSGKVIHQGVVRSAQLPSFVAQFRPPATSVAEVAELNGDSVAIALSQYVVRQSSPPGVSQGILPAVPIDLPDSLCELLDDMVSDGASPTSGVRVKWPAGPRSVVFDPPIQLTLKKVVEVDLEVDKVTVNGREITFSVVSPRLWPDLTVRVK